MTVYVDSLREYPDRGLRYSAWCHLMADRREELHAMADRLGLPRRIFQDHPVRWHYDLPAPLREQAVLLGAQEIDMHAVGAILRARRTG